MQDLQGLTVSNFENKANIILGKAEVDKDGLGNFVELEDITSFNIQSNITNIFQSTCAISFSIALLNTDDKYSLFNTGANHYDYIKEGRKIRLYLGANLKPDAGVHDDYYWSWVYGIIDKPTMEYDEAGERCNITGRDYIAYLSEVYLKKLWWGKNKKYDIVANQEKYSMPSDCTGIYRVFVSRSETEKDFKETTLNSEWTYDWTTNEFVFLHPSVPFEDADGCLWIYYFTAQNVAVLVADLLTEAGIMNYSERYLWLLNPLLCTPTSKVVDRAWFESGTNYITAINMLTEVATIYRFYINGEGKPCFKRIPLLSAIVKRIDDTEYLIRKWEERLDELYNHFILIGEYREMKKKCLSVREYTGILDLKQNEGTLRGAVIDDGGSTLKKKGFLWETGEEVPVGEWYNYSSSIGYFSHLITDLIAGTEYRFCAVAENSAGDRKQTIWIYFVTPDGE